MGDRIPDEDLTGLLQAWRGGDAGSEEKLINAVSRELRRLAENYLWRERAGHTLEPPALVNELYLRLLGQRQVDWKSRSHFFAIASREMRRILVDYARQRNAAKRAQPAGERVSLSEVEDPAGAQDPDLLDLHDALEELALANRRQADILELRYFSGLAIDELSDVMRLSPATVKREIGAAKQWLRDRLQEQH